MARCVYGAGAGGPTAAEASARPEGRRATPGGPMAESVTRHGEITSECDWKYLGCGVDGLELGLGVYWGRMWEALRESLDKAKAKAAWTDGLLWSSSPSLGPVLILPSGRKMYRFHLQVSGFHLWIGRSPKPCGRTPNAFVSIASEALWRHGVLGSIERVRAFMAEMGGQVRQATVSRVDLCADFLIPGGLSLDFIKRHLVNRAQKTRHVEDAGCLETFYAGSPGADIQCRIYDKSKEIEHSGKQWFFELWGLTVGPDVWRFEFELRRRALRDYGVKAVADLSKVLGGIWSNLTEEWLTLRLADDSNASRRSLYPGWVQVQGCARNLGPAMEVRRMFDSRNPASANWYRSHMGGCLLGYAAQAGVTDLGKAIGQLGVDLREYWEERDFQKELIVRAVRMGLPVEVDDEIPF